MTVRSIAVRHTGLFVDFLHIYKYSLLKQYVFVPIGVILIMMILYGVNILIKDVIGIKFPASVAVMLVNFCFLCVLSMINENLTQKIVGVIDVPLSWALRWMNLFFTPAFVTLPLSPWISFREAMLIAASFVFMYIITGFCLAYVTIFGQKLFALATGHLGRSNGRKRTSLLGSKEDILRDAENGYSSADEDATEEESTLDINEDDDDIHSFADIFSDPDVEDFQLVNVASNSGFPLQRTRTNLTHHLAMGDTANLDADILRGSEIGLPNDKGLGITQNVQDIYDEDNTHGSDSTAETNQLLLQPALIHSRNNAAMVPMASKRFCGSTSHDQFSDRNREVECERAITRQFSHRMEHLFTVNMWHDHLHHVLYGLGFFATIFTYYFSWYIMPFQLFTAICMFFIVTDAPLLPNPKYKKFLHPVICSVALFWIVELISSLIKHRQIKYFLSDLREYKVGTTYLTLFTNTSVSGPNKNWPGAGDIFSSCMDVSIVALSMPMYTYRSDLKKHFVVLLIPTISLCAATLMLNPFICYNIGISSYNSIGFIGRSITLALGMPVIENFEGSVTVMAVITVLSGIVGALSGGPMLDFFRVPRDDFVTRGLTLGCNCGAIATSYLLTVDRRAAAISSLSFVLYGAIMVILSSIGPIKDFVHQIVSL